MLPQAIIIDETKIKTALVENKKYSRSSIIYSDNRQVRINDVLPFRIRFTDVRLPGYGPNNIPGIGLQIIGYSNYIL